MLQHGYSEPQGQDVLIQEARNHASESAPGGTSKSTEPAFPSMQSCQPCSGILSAAYLLEEYAGTAWHASGS